MPRFCNKTFKRRKFGSNKDSSASEDLKKGQEQPASIYIKNSSSKSKLDGTWQKRGHTSLNGVVTAVSVDTGKVVDAEILSRKCSCHFNGNLHSDECSANYFRNSGGMEVEDALRIFNRSEAKSSKTKKSLGGRNRLTDAEIDKLQRCYGLAIRNNSGNLSAMKQAIWAIFFHKISTDLNPQHGLCPLGDDSWCGYNRSKLKGDTYKHKHNLPIAIMHCIKKVFRHLLSPELLSRCLHGLITKLKVLDLLNIQPGFYTCRALQEADHARIRKAEKAISRRTKEARIKNRQIKCRQEDDLADDPSNPSYGSGTDHAHIRKTEKAISQRTKEARIKNRQLKCRQEDDLGDDPSNPSYGSGMY
ncbi:uncharacterized protein TNCV_2177381 [Trichonephila clavipes]|uniref:Mutator-like transposase domain-containing protein n=1 Tax=Trichonephila clavipes TaxID=2585209 RepID=A0A8X6VU11_TRICX|nr:uncharacterized protein TNCV_2177381 [Trichonephila clavipes]